MADEKKMREFFEKYLDEHGFHPESNEYWVVHHEVAIDGDPYKHTHLIAIPKKGNQRNDKN